MRSLEELAEYLNSEFAKLQEKSLVHSKRHVQAVINISSSLIGHIKCDDKLIREKVLIAAILHDWGRFVNMEGLDHAAVSSVIGKRILEESEIPSAIIEELIDSVKNHTKGGSENLTGKIIYTADKLEQLAPIAPFRRSIHVGEILSNRPLSPQDSLAEYISYFLAKVGKLSYESIEKKGVRIPQEIRERIPEYNSVFISKLEAELGMEIRKSDDLKEVVRQNALKAFTNKENTAIELVLLGINIGYGCCYTRKPYVTLLKTTERMIKEGFSSEDVSFLRKYRKNVKDYLKTWSRE